MYRGLPFFCLRANEEGRSYRRGVCKRGGQGAVRVSTIRYNKWIEFVRQLSAAHPGQHPLSAFTNYTYADVIRSKVIILPQGHGRTREHTRPLSHGPFLQLHITFTPSSILSTTPLLPVQRGKPVVTRRRTLVAVAKCINTGPARFGESNVPRTDSFEVTDAEQCFSGHARR